jgi:hypothetical protein
MDRSIGNVNWAFNQYGIILADSSIAPSTAALPDFIDMTENKRWHLL